MKNNRLLTCLLPLLAFQVSAEVALTDGVVHRTGNSADADLNFSITLTEDASSLNIFTQGRTGDADLALIETNGAAIDCEVEKSGTSEACVIKAPKAGTYTFKLTAYEAFSDAVVYASTQVYAQQHTCDELMNETVVNIQSPLLEMAQVNEICQTLKVAETRFHELLNTNLIPVPNDQNGSVNVNIFANQSAYMTTGQFEQNMRDDAATGIYFESDPETEYAQANVNTFEAHRWADGEFFIWELAHEYVHYLDGRYNKQGSYSTTEPHDITWWTEGVAEYIADYDSPYMNVSLVHSPENFEANDIVTSGYGGDASPYDWGTLLVRYLVEQQPDKLAEFRQLTRSGDYDGMDSWLDTWSKEAQSTFATWQLNELISDFADRAMPLAMGDSLMSTSQHGQLYYIDMQAGETLTISTQLGGGNVDLYVSAGSVPNKYDATQFVCRSNFSSLEETCSVESTEDARYYVLLDAPGYAIFVNSQVAVSDQYIESQYNYQLCAAEVPYVDRDSSYSVNVSVTNDSSNSIQIYWLNYANGARSEKVYATLASGESWESTWYKGDRVVVTDSDANCITTHSLAESGNEYSFDGEALQQVTAPDPGPEVPEQSDDSSSGGGSTPHWLIWCFAGIAILRRKF